MKELLLTEYLVEMKWHPANKDRYVALGYNFTRMGEVFYAKAVDVAENSSGAKIPVKCDYCGNTYYPTSRNYKKSHIKKDKDCCVSCKGEEIRETVQNRYGVNNVVELSSVRAKMKETCLSRYGAATPLHSDEIFQKTQASFNAHYGVENGIKDLRNVVEISQKIKATNIERYGGESPLSSPEIKAKIAQKMYENGTCKTSNKQIELNQMLIDLYGNSELNYPCDKVSLDCMTIINDIMIDVEYDGWFWHKDREKEDMRRDFFVESKGYKVVRFMAYDNRLPTEQELREAINKITTTDRKFTKVELNKI